MDRQEKFLRELKTFFWENSLGLDLSQLERLAYFAELIAEKNDEVNLISRKDVDNLIENHVFVSSLIADYIPDKCNKFLDIGTGGGFPGIPLAISRPLLRGVLVDSTSKKISAVQEFIEKLKLSNVKAENQRVESEEFIEQHANSFDLVVSRATVPMIILLRYALPLIKDKAYLMAVKGGNLNEEMIKAEMKYKSFIKKSTIFELAYKPTNVRNVKNKKLIIYELNK